MHADCSSVCTSFFFLFSFHLFPFVVSYFFIPILKWLLLYLHVICSPTASRHTKLVHFLPFDFLTLFFPFFLLSFSYIFPVNLFSFFLIDSLTENHIFFITINATKYAHIWIYYIFPSYLISYIYFSCSFLLFPISFFQFYFCFFSHPWYLIIYSHIQNFYLYLLFYNFIIHINHVDCFYNLMLLTDLCVPLLFCINYLSTFKRDPCSMYTNLFVL